MAGYIITSLFTSLRTFKNSHLTHPSQYGGVVILFWNKHMGELFLVALTLCCLIFSPPHEGAVAVIQYWTESSIKSRFMLQYSFEDRWEGTCTYIRVESYVAMIHQSYMLKVSPQRKWPAREQRSKILFQNKNTWPTYFMIIVKIDRIMHTNVNKTLCTFL